MKHTEIVADAFDFSPVFEDHKNISVSDAKSFWLDQQAQGKVDIIFKKVEQKLKLLWQKIKDGTATDKEYSSAYLLVSEDVLLAQASYDCNKNTVELPKNEAQSPERCKEEVRGPDPDVCDTPLPFITQHVRFLAHTCRETCLSEVNPYFIKRGNPLRFPLLCQFHRWHAKSDLLSRQLDVIYKAPCGKSLRSYEDVHAYLFQTMCHFLSLDYFSFNTFLQLERKSVTDPAVVQEADISRDVELVPVSLCNEIDNTKPSPFTYRKSPWPRGYFVNNFTDLFIGCCDCTDGCLDISTCTCLQLTAKACSNNNVSSPKQPVTTGYKYKRLQAPIPTGLYECNVSCKCDRRMCQNRVVQHGLQVRLQVYKTIEKGWGVRCLDDIDKGTFVCIYAGQILMNASNVNTQDASPCVMQTDDNKPTSIFSKRKRPISLSDSEITNPPPNSSSSQKPGDARVTSGSSHQPKITIRNKISRCQVGNTGLLSVKRPKTKTAILQQRRRRLMEKGAVTVQHSSDEDDFVIPVSSRKPMHTSRLGHEGGDAEKTDAGYLSDNSTMSIQSTESNIQLSACKQKDAIQHPESEENIRVLDASKEGNVARFLNHSCLPNLFVQPVFVETHSKKFPWVAFFTKSYLKAGTELSWDYNYNIGSVPEEEIPCLCGQKTCQNITV